MNKQLKEKLNKNKEVTLGSWISLAHPAIAEIMCNADFEWIVIDLEHSSITLSQAEELIRVIDLKGKSPLVRLSSNDPTQAKRIMDMGAHGIVCPMVNSKSDAEKIYKSMHYPNVGFRGVGLARAQSYGNSFHEYKKDLSDSSILVVQIEHIDAVDNLEEILSVKGVDAYIIGPYDLSASMGIPGEFDNPKLIEALERVKEVGIKMNIPGGIHIVEPDLNQLDQRIEEGYKFLAYSVCMRMLDHACREGYKHFQKKISK
jgi:2-dehydro-3-deoxyglucarate aldolase